MRDEEKLINIVFSRIGSFSDLYVTSSFGIYPVDGVVVIFLVALYEYVEMWKTSHSHTI